MSRASKVIALVLGLLTVSSGGASAMEAGPAALRPKLALVLQPATHFEIPASWPADAPQKALDFGAQEACMNGRTATALRPALKCLAPIVDMPTTDVCTEPSLEDIFANNSTCTPGDGNRTADLVLLSSAGCGNGVCGVADAEKVGATHLVIVDAVWSNELAVLTLTAELFTLGTGESRKITPTAFEPKMKNGSPYYYRGGLVPLAILKWFAREITISILQGRTVGERSALPGSSVVAAAPALPSVVTSQGVSSLGAGPRALPNDHDGGHRWVAWTLVGVGVAAGIGSAVDLSMHGHKKDCVAVPGDSDPCRQSRSAIPGIAFGAAALGAFVGATVLFLHDDNGSLALSVHPVGPSLSLGGSF